MENLTNNFDLVKSTKTETRRAALDYAQKNDCHVKLAYDFYKNLWFELMSDIHENGKEGNYELAGLYKEAYSTLEDYNIEIEEVVEEQTKELKNIITLLNNKETLELGATLAVSQGLEEKIKAFYYAKLKNKNYNSRRFFKTQSIDYRFNGTAKKRLARRGIQISFSHTRQYFLDVIIAINNVLFPSTSNVLPF